MLKLRYVLLLCSLVSLSACSSCGDGGGGAAGGGGQFAVGLGPNDDLDQDGIINSEDSDADGDGVENNTDCNDLDAAIFPGAEDFPDDNITDSNCDGVDGTKTAGIWVSLGEGDDTNAGSFDKPVKTISKAVLLAAALPENDRNVYIVAGDYPEDVALQNNVNLFGGYGALFEGTRVRSLTQFPVYILGVQNSVISGIKQHSSTNIVGVTMLVQNTESVIDAVNVYGELDQQNVVVRNSNLLVSNSTFELPPPTVDQPIMANMYVLTDTDSNTFYNVILKNNRFVNHGNNKAGALALKGKYFGVYAFPEKNSEGNLNLKLEGNQFISTGRSELNSSIAVADDDADQSDNDEIDQHAHFTVHVADNSFDISGEYRAICSLMAGFPNAACTLGFKDADELFYIQSLKVERNSFFIHANTEYFAGINVGLSRDISFIKNNEVYMNQGGSEFSSAVTSRVSKTDILNNTFYFENIQKDFIGVFLDFKKPAQANLFAANRVQRVNNNIIALRQEGVARCNANAALERVEGNPNVDVHGASPLTFKQNVIHLETPCAKVFYLDSEGASIATIDDLNNKVGFAVDDPTEISGNISADPLFNNLATHTLTLDANSPAVDAAITEEDVTHDLARTSRPQGNASDIGAYER